MTLKLDPEERPSVEECIEHTAFQTEHAMDRNTRVPVKSSSAHSSSKKRRTDDTEKQDKSVFYSLYHFRAMDLKLK